MQRLGTMRKHPVIKLHAPKALMSILMMVLGELSAATLSDAIAKGGTFFASVLRPSGLTYFLPR